MQNVVNEKYELGSDKEVISEYICNKYYKNTEINSDNYIKKAYYVDETIGFCLKSTSEICSNGKKSSSETLINELNFNSTFVDNFFTDLLTYEEGVAQMDFDEWPHKGLGALLPECKSGKFMFGVDYGNDATISIENISLTEVRNYTYLIAASGFNQGKSATNEANQFVYVTYNDYNVLVKLMYTETYQNLTINISYSNIDEINKELGKL